jgi:UDP-2-acetamido-2,6-beta-L-arabino-hexul-4-ose reductase
VTVAILGANGFIGWHVQCGLHAQGIPSRAIGRESFESASRLAADLTDSSVIVHAAGANRGIDADIEKTNLRLAEMIAAAVSGRANPPLIVHVNSTHFDGDTAYGRSKRQAADILELASGGRLVDLVVPGVFGEKGRPFYNSVVSTFCYQLSIGEPLSINDDASIELIHAQTLADAIIDAIESREYGRRRIQGRLTGVVELANNLKEIESFYSAGVIPSLDDSFQRDLFNTLRSYRFLGHKTMPLEPRRDERGELVEAVKSESGGQCFVSTTKSGVVRGQHYHRRKVERFVVLEGAAVVSLRRMFSNDVIAIEVTGANPVAIDIPTLHTHNIVNIGSESLVTLFWANEIFNPEAPDTYGEEV